MAGQSIDLLSLFQAASSVLGQNKAQLNQADTYNSDHGDNMAQVFNLITQAIGQKKSAAPAQQLSYASQLLQQQASSGSSQLYAKALQTAAGQMQGQKTINANNIMPLIQSLLGAGNQPQADVFSGAGGLENLLGGLLGGTSGTTGSVPAASQSQGFGADDLLRGGMAYMQSQQAGGDPLSSIVNALIAGSPLGETPSRAMSAQMVAQALLAKARPLLASIGKAKAPAKNTKAPSRTGSRSSNIGTSPKSHTGQSAGQKARR